ncbi:integrator complex subunit 6 isoform X1 [Takifugu flavidus]|uniref:Integrator complex subunit 6 n=1 Tax=Takifugu flavidus TaxID=433684 RepID=A0A5C6ML38_9TELE|nr:integrator complex subunit 6 isoform X1 [Takifugu flavidus]TWW55832.1 Integrator complex subunit 6 [Takifugu flavidus]
MPILLFLLDTSASMNQRTYLGTTYLDVAKGAVEVFMKLRARDPASRGDRYMLVTFDDPPYGVKAGWKENHTTFMCELKNLQASGLTTLGHALRTAFDLLNLNRLVSGIDNYGQGRNPFYLEPAVIITITDGNKLTHSSGVPDELHLPLHSPLVGSELTKEPFRWDQRLFALVLRLPGATRPDNEQLGSVPTDDSAITQMCEVTGGRSYCVRTQRMLNQCLESLVQKVQSGVVINFEKTGPDPPLVGEDNSVELNRAVPDFNLQPWQSCHKLIYVRPNPKTGVPIGHWPIPESFWPDQNTPTLPPRAAHPVVRFSCVDCEPMVIDKLPFDKYELEPSPLTQFILERKSPHSCWQVFVSSSMKQNDLGQPFGYLKASTTLTCVNLFVMPYNYPVLLPLLDDLFKVHKLKPNVKWRQAFEIYLKTMPPYYLMPLKKALRMMGAPNLIAENMDCGLSYSVISYLKKLSQQAKLESDRLIVSVGKKAPQEIAIKVKNQSSSPSLSHYCDFKHLLQGISGEGPLRLADLKEFSGFQIALLNKDVKPQAYRNAFDIPRRNLLDHLTRMRSNLLQRFQKRIRGQDEDSLHSVPVAQMGNYQEYLKMMPSPLRELDPDQPKRLHTFGNPFKQDKKGMMIDEADEFVTGPQNKKRGTSGDLSSGVAVKRRRSMSPLLRRSQTPPGNNNHAGAGNSPAGVQGQQNALKAIPQHREGDGNDMVVMESNGGLSLEAESGDNWPAKADIVSKHSSSPNAEQKAGLGAAEPEGGVNPAWERLEEVHLGQQLLKETHNCEELSPENHLEGTEPDPETANTIFIAPLDGSQAELRSRVIKEVRKPGRNYEPIVRLLQQVKGPVDVQKYVIQHAIKEAVRFKKHVLIQQLQTTIAELEKKESTANQQPTSDQEM